LGGNDGYAGGYCSAFVLDHIKRGHSQFVALSAGDVVGWCDVLPKERPIYKKVGFATEGVQRHAVQVDGVYEDLILMAVLF
jgi:hypothetical protein